MTISRRYPVFRCKSTSESQPAERVAAPLATGVGAVREKAAGAGQALTPRVDAVREKAAGAGHALAPRVDAAREKLAPYAATARGSLEEAVEWAAPRVEEAREAVREKAATAAITVAPKVAAALGTAAAVSAPLAHEARERGEAALHALRGELPPEKKRRWPTAVLFLGIGAAIGFAAAMFAKRTSPAAGPYASGAPLDLASRQPMTSAPVGPAPTPAPEPSPGPVTPAPVPESSESMAPPIGEGQVGLGGEVGGVTDEPPTSPRP